MDYVISLLFGLVVGAGIGLVLFFVVFLATRRRKLRGKGFGTVHQIQLSASAYGTLVRAERSDDETALDWKEINGASAPEGGGGHVRQD